MGTKQKRSKQTTETTVERMKPGETCPAAVDGQVPEYAPELEYRPDSSKE